MYNVTFITNRLCPSRNTIKLVCHCITWHSSQTGSVLSPTLFNLYASDHEPHSWHMFVNKIGRLVAITAERWKWFTQQRLQHVWNEWMNWSVISEQCDVNDTTQLIYQCMQHFLQFTFCLPLKPSTCLATWFAPLVSNLFFNNNNNVRLL